MTLQDATGPFHPPTCPACGRDRPNAVQMDLRVEGGQVRGPIRFGPQHEGAPGVAHGGAVAAVFDDILGMAGGLMGLPSVTANLNIDYRRPTPLEKDLELVVWPLSQEGRKTIVAGEIRDADVVVAEARALLINVPGIKLAGAYPDEPAGAASA